MVGQGTEDSFPSTPITAGFAKVKVHAADRKHWNPAALHAQDEEARAFEEAMLPGLLEECRDLATALEREVTRISGAFFTTQ